MSNLVYQAYQKHKSISTDTRNILPNSIFFALKGANFNGNAFAEQALASGAAYAVIDEVAYQKDERYLLVEDVLSSLQELALMHRKQLQIPVIGITGTNGKTTTKELLYAVLSEKFNTFATKGNLNNHIGVPLSVLAIDDRVEIAIIEMGANHLEEIKLLSHIAEPTHGLISNVGKAHLEGFGSFEGVQKAKGELYDFLQEQKGTLFLQADNPYLSQMAAQRHFEKIVRYGFSENNDIIGELIQANPLIQLQWKTKLSPETYVVQTQLTGSYNTENFLAAIAVGLEFGLNADEINAGMAGYTPTNNRSQVTKTADNTVICDYYNANASSMAAALDNIKVIDAPRKVIILGDMFELGNESDIEHQKLVDNVLQIPAERIILVGQAFFKQQQPGAEFYKTTEEALKAIQEKPIQEAMILLKASRGMHFESLIGSL